MSPRPDSSSPIWSAALLAAGCTATRNGESLPVHWQSVRGRLYYWATETVLVRPLDVAVQAGEILEVQWSAGDTGYSTAIVQPCQSPKGGAAQCQAA
jgi:hypothetical protein